MECASVYPKVLRSRRNWLMRTSTSFLRVAIEPMQRLRHNGNILNSNVRFSHAKTDSPKYYVTKYGATLYKCNNALRLSRIPQIPKLHCCPRHCLYHRSPYSPQPLSVSYPRASVCRLCGLSSTGETLLYSLCLLSPGTCTELSVK